MKNLTNEINVNHYYGIWSNKVSMLYVDCAKLDKPTSKTIDERAKEVYVVNVCDKKNNVRTNAGYVSIYNDKAIFWNEVNHETIAFTDLNAIVPVLNMEFMDMLSQAQMEFEYINAYDLAIIFRDPMHKSACMFGQFDCITLTDVLDD